MQPSSTEQRSPAATFPSSSAAVVPPSSLALSDPVAPLPSSSAGHSSQQHSLRPPLSRLADHLSLLQPSSTSCPQQRHLAVHRRLLFPTQQRLSRPAAQPSPTSLSTSSIVIHLSSTQQHSPLTLATISVTTFHLSRQAVQPSSTEQRSPAATFPSSSAAVVPPSSLALSDPVAPLPSSSAGHSSQQHSLRPPLSRLADHLSLLQPSSTSCPQQRHLAVPRRLLFPTQQRSPAAQWSYHPIVQPSSTSFPPNSTALLHLFALASSNSPAKQCSRNLSFSHPAAQPSPVQQHSGRTTQQSTSLPINSIAVVHLSMQPSSKCCAALSHLAFRLFPNYSSRTTVVHLSHPAVPLPSSSTALSLLI